MPDVSPNPDFAERIWLLLSDWRWWPLDTNQSVTLALTAAIAIAVTVQAIFAWKLTGVSREQLEIAKRLFKQDVDRQTPKIRLTHMSRGFFDGVDENGLLKHLSFDGFSIANVGWTEVVIGGWTFDLGVNEASSSRERCQNLTHDVEYRGEKISTAHFPHRLASQDSVTVLIERSRLIAELDELFDGEQHRVMPIVSDRFGNKYPLGVWLEWREASTTSYDEPLPGYRPSDPDHIHTGFSQRKR